MIIAKDIEAYAKAHSDGETDVLAALAAETRETMQYAGMMVGPLEGGLLRTMARVSGARRVLEIGTFTGYSALWLADGVPLDGQVITLDNDAHSTTLAKKYWAKSPVGHKIRLELGDALDTLPKIAGPLDLAFIDADKKNYINYWDAVVPLVRSGGLIIVDNVLWGGDVLDPKSESDHAIVAFNAHAAKDSRVERVMLTVRDGMTVATKR